MEDLLNSDAGFHRILAQCDRRVPIGRRDYAILMLLSRLGLRAGEVSSLTLDDINWDQGYLNVRGKGTENQLLFRSVRMCDSLQLAEPG